MKKTMIRLLRFRLFREPLLHFLLLGAVIFVLYSWRSTGDTSSAKEIVVTRGIIENLATTFMRVWNRPPTQEEMDSLVQEYIREEACAREAIAMGLDRDDTIIRRRLRQKMEFLFQDVVAQAEPSDSELLDYLKAHPESFRKESHFTFSHVYLNPDRHSSDLEQVSAELLAQLQKLGVNADPVRYGDPFMLEHRFENLRAGEVEALFGEPFAAEMSRVSVGQWKGPVQSGYGIHFVFLAQRSQAGTPSLEEVREEVRREWSHAKQLEAKDRFYKEMLAGYTVTIEETDEAQKNLARAR